MPFRTNVLYISVGKKLPTYTITTTVGEQISITGVTHVYYQQIAEDNVGFNSTAFYSALLQDTIQQANLQQLQ